MSAIIAVKNILRAKLSRMKSAYTYGRKRAHYLPPVGENKDEPYRVSFVVPVYNTEKKILTDCIESVLNQDYHNVELVLVDDASTMKETTDTLKSYEGNPRVKVAYHKENKHIAETTNDAIALSSGEFIAFMDCDDFIEPGAVSAMVAVQVKYGYDFIYTDSDNTDHEGKSFFYPLFKPDWSPDTFMSIMYTSHLSMYRASIVKELGGLRSDFNGSQDYDLTLRFIEKIDKVGHVPYVCYHWRNGKNSTSSNPTSKMYAYTAAKRAKEEAVKRQGRKAELTYLSDCYQTRVDWCVPQNAEVILVTTEPINEEQVHFKVTWVEMSSYEIEDVNVLYRKLEEYDISDKLVLVARTDLIELPEAVDVEKLLGHAALSHAGFVGLAVKEKDGERILSGFDESGNVIDGGNLPLASLINMPFNVLSVNKEMYAVRGKVLKEVVGSLQEGKFSLRDACLHACKKGYYNVVRNDCRVLRK